MSLAMTAEQDGLRTTVRRFLADNVPLTRVRELMASEEAFDPAIWRGIADLGVTGLAVPEEYGGEGYGMQELCYVFEECGRALLPGPLLATLGLVLPVLLASDDKEAQASYLPGIAAGTTKATLGWISPGGGWNSAGQSVTASQGGGGRWTLSGSTEIVLNGMDADLVLVVAGQGPESMMVAIDPKDDGIARTGSPSLDQTRHLASFEFRDARCVPIGQVGDGERLLSVALDYANVLLSAEMVGGTQACLDMSVDYAKIREQFGRPIGSFQAIKHKCAEMLVGLEGARAATYYAAWAAAENPAELPVVASLAKAVAAESYFRAAAENVQIHGGIGFTWEHDAHLYLKRAKTSSMLFGDVGAYRRQLADRIGL